MSSSVNAKRCQREPTSVGDDGYAALYIGWCASRVFARRRNHARCSVGGSAICAANQSRAPSPPAAAAAVSVATSPSIVTRVGPNDACTSRRDAACSGVSVWLNARSR